MYQLTNFGCDGHGRLIIVSRANVLFCGLFYSILFSQQFCPCKRVIMYKHLDLNEEEKKEAVNIKQCTDYHAFRSALYRDSYLVQLFLCFRQIHKFFFFYLVLDQLIQVEAYQFSLNQHECFLC